MHTDVANNMQGGAKCFVYFSRFLPVKRLFQKIDCILKSNSLPTPKPNPLLNFLCYSGVTRVKIFVLKHWMFLEDIWNFNKWKSLIIHEKCWDTMENNAKGNYNFATKFKSTENVENKCGSKGD